MRPVGRGIGIAQPDLPGRRRIVILGVRGGYITSHDHEGELASVTKLLHHHLHVRSLQPHDALLRLLILFADSAQRNAHEAYRALAIGSSRKAR